MTMEERIAMIEDLEEIKRLRIVISSSVFSTSDKY